MATLKRQLAALLSAPDDGSGNKDMRLARFLQVNGDGLRAEGVPAEGIDHVRRKAAVKIQMAAAQEQAGDPGRAQFGDMFSMPGAAAGALAGAALAPIPGVNLGALPLMLAGGAIGAQQAGIPEGERNLAELLAPAQQTMEQQLAPEGEQLGQLLAPNQIPGVPQPILEAVKGAGRMGVGFPLSLLGTAQRAATGDPDTRSQILNLPGDVFTNTLGQFAGEAPVDNPLIEQLGPLALLLPALAGFGGGPALAGMVAAPIASDIAESLPDVGRGASAMPLARTALQTPEVYGLPAAFGAKAGARRFGRRAAEAPVEAAEPRAAVEPPLAEPAEAPTTIPALGELSGDPATRAGQLMPVVQRLIADGRLQPVAARRAQQALIRAANGDPAGLPDVEALVRRATEAPPAAPEPAPPPQASPSAGQSQILRRLGVRPEAARPPMPTEVAPVISSRIESPTAMRGPRDVVERLTGQFRSDAPPRSRPTPDVQFLPPEFEPPHPIEQVAVPRAGKKNVFRISRLTQQPPVRKALAPTHEAPPMAAAPVPPPAPIAPSEIVGGELVRPAAAKKSLKKKAQAPVEAPARLPVEPPASVPSPAVATPTEVPARPAADIPRVEGAPRTWDTSVIIPNTGKRYPARYALVDIRDVQASHDPPSFRRNPNYRGQQERINYEQPDEQARIQRQAAALDPRLVLSDSSLSGDGPPQITATGDALGGNRRTMILRLALERHPEKFAEYTEALRSKADHFGFRPEDVGPGRVLVRVLEPESLAGQDLMRVSGDLNVEATTAKGGAEVAAAAGRRLSPDTMELVASLLDKGTEPISLRDAMRDPKAGPKIIHRFVDDGAIPKGELARYLRDDGKVTDEGKLFVEKAMLGTLIGDARIIDSLPDSFRDKLIKSSSPIIRMIKLGPEADARGTLAEAVREAVRLQENPAIRRLQEGERTLGIATGAPPRGGAESLKAAILRVAPEAEPHLGPILEAARKGNARQKLRDIPELAPRAGQILDAIEADITVGNIAAALATEGPLKFRARLDRYVQALGQRTLFSGDVTPAEALRESFKGATLAALAGLTTYALTEDEDRAFEMMAAVSLPFGIGRIRAARQMAGASRSFLGQQLAAIVPQRAAPTPPLRPSAPLPHPADIQLDVALRPATVRAGPRKLLRRIGERYGIRYGNPQFSEFLDRTGMLEGMAEMNRIRNKVMDHMIGYVWGDRSGLKTAMKWWADRPALWDIPKKLREGRQLSPEDFQALRDPEVSREVLDFTNRFGEYLDAVRDAGYPEHVRQNYYPHTLGAFVDWIGSKLGREIGVSTGALDARRLTKLDPTRNPAEVAHEYMGWVAKKAAVRPFLEKLQELRKIYQQTENMQEARITEELARRNVANEAFEVDQGLAEALGIDILKRKWAPGQDFKADGSYGYSGQGKVIAEAYDSPRRGRTFTVEFDGRRLAHPLSEAEISLIDAAAGPEKYRVMSRPAQVATASMGKLASMMVILGNTRSFVTQLTSNIPRLAAELHRPAHLSVGAKHALDYWFDRLPADKVREYEMTGLIKGEHFQFGGRAFGVIERFQESLFARTLALNITLVDRTVSIMAYEASKLRLQESGRGLPAGRIQDLAAIEAMKITDYVHPVIHATYSGHPLHSLATLFQKPAIREMQQISSIIRDIASPQWKRGAAKLATLIGLRGAATLGLVKLLGLDDEETRELLLKSLPFWSWARATHYKTAPIVDIFPAISIGQGTAKAWMQGFDEIYRGEGPQARTLQRGLPVWGFRTPRDLLDGLYHGDPRARKSLVVGGKDTMREFQGDAARQARRKFRLKVEKQIEEGR